MKVRGVHALFTALDHETFPEEQIHYGNPDMEVQGVLTCWMANVRAIRAAVDQGCNVIVCHETPFLGRVADFDFSPVYAWPANRQRKAMLDEHGLAVIQVHRTLDAFCIADVFQDMLGLGRPTVAEEMAGYICVRLFETEPTPVGQLIDRWKQATGLSCVRAYAPDLDHVVRRIGLAWGGIGLHSNMAVMVRLIDLGAELLLGGETEEYTIQFCADAGVDFIEMGHAVSEAPGTLAAGRHFAAQFPDLEVVLFDEPPLYRFV